MSEQGWQLIRGGAISSRFKREEGVRYRYQLDYQPSIDDMPRYLETFQEQGWEYVSSSFNGWHYFRKLYDPAQPETAYEIFTDRASLREMNDRWSKLAGILAAIIGLFALLSAVRLILYPHWVALAQTLAPLAAALILARGVAIMRDPDKSRSRRGDSALLAAFFAVLILGSAAQIALMEARPDFSVEYLNEESAPITEMVWGEIGVSYGDNYFFDLTIHADTPLTVTLLSADGEVVYTVTDRDFESKNLRLYLVRGNYLLCLSDFAGGRLEVDCRLS